MGCPVCQEPMIKSKVGFLCLNCGHLEEHGHHAHKAGDDHHEAAHHAPTEHHEAAHHAPAHHDKPAAAKKPAAKKAAPAHRTVSDIKRKSH